MKRNKIISLLPFGIAFAMALISIFEVLLIPDTVSYNVVSSPIGYASFGLLFVLVFVLGRKNYWKHIFALLLIIALTPLIQFYHYAFSFGIGFIQIELISLALLIFHLKVNREVVSDCIRFFKTREEDKQQEKDSHIDFFEKKFTTKDKAELEKIVEQNTLVPEAVEAAKRLLKEYQSDHA